MSMLSINNYKEDGILGVLTLLLLIIGIVYGGLTSLAGAIQLRQKKINLCASLAMIAGGILTIIIIIPDLGTYTMKFPC